ncbi:DUF4249 domain-containing protein [Flavobacterium sp. HTF]|uniref:DUF4249 domain-containing protein n=1 Tax=Flavobacterium sp. HTF TaxID=2170732 RepID=UPI00269AC4C1|nr:DUF4249 domain-containing protein [Flavobacterium sp. HTF]
MIKIYQIKNIIIFAILSILLNGCTETYPLLTNNYEEIVIVETTITNELKNHEIKLTKTSKFEDEDIEPETGAKVFITDNAGNQYDFEEDSESYISTTPFQALPDRKYQLHITTEDGRSFESSQETLTAVNPIESITPAVEIKDKVNGIAIRVNSFDSSNRSKYYRYKYEETYKVIAPKWTTTKATIGENATIVLVPNSPTTRICYGNKKNAELLLDDTKNKSEDRVNFMVRFIDAQDYITTTRYSILVTQYVESQQAYTYYAILKKMAGPGSIVSPTQPGVLLGNIKSVKNSGDKIVGYFDVASVSTERIYFNHSDLYPGEGAPPYIVDCKEFCYADYPFSPDPCTHNNSPFVDLQFGRITYFLQGAEYTYWVDAPCGDCTTIASNIKPTFWTD